MQNKQVDIVTDVMEFAEHYPWVQNNGKLVRFLQQLDHLITLHQRKVENLKKIKKAMLEKMFPKEDLI